MIFLDMDGVLADFNGAANVVHGRPDEPPATKWNWFEDWGTTHDEFWAAIHNLGHAFYGMAVKPYEWARLVYNMCYVTDEVVIVTAPSDHAYGYSGKKIWIDNHFPGARLIVTGEKHLLAAPDRLLIDDNLGNVHKFREAGGYAHLFKQPWNSSPDFTANRIPALKRELSLWAETQSSPNTLSRYDRNGAIA